MVDLMKGLVIGSAALMLAACGDDTATGAGAASDAGSATEAPADSAEAVTNEDGARAAVSAATKAVNEAAEAATSQLSGAVMGDVVYGDPNAPIEVIEYASFTCGACAGWAVYVLPELEEKYLKTGIVKLVFRNSIRDRLDLAAAMTARCSTLDATRELTKQLFLRQGDWARAQDPVTALASIARRAGISRTDLDRCLADRDLSGHLVEMTQTGQREFDVQGTPTVLVNGRKVANTWESLDEAIQAAQ